MHIRRRLYLEQGIVIAVRTKWSLLTSHADGRQHARECRRIHGITLERESEREVPVGPSVPAKRQPEKAVA